MYSSVAGASHPQDVEQTALQSIQQVFFEIPQLFIGSFQHELAYLKSLAESAEDFADHKAYGQVARALSAEQERILNYIKITFAKLLKDAGKAHALAEEEALNFHTHHLSIVTDKELVYQLKLEAGFSRSRDTFDGALVQSGWKFCSAAKQSEVQEQLDAIRPGGLALILQGALDQFIDDKLAARIGYRFIAGHFFQQLSKHYEMLTPALKNLSDALIAAKTKKPKPFGNDLPLPEVDEIEADHRDEPREKAPKATIDVTGLLKNWDVPAQLRADSDSDFTGFSDISLEQLSASTQIRNASIEDVTHLLRTLSDSALIDTDAGLNIQDIRSALKQSLSQLSGEGILTVIDKVSENVLNLVTHLFENINQEGMLINEVVNQLTRVQGPVMQVALRDSKLFQSPQHPVRQYLNTLGDLGMRISEPAEEGFLELRDSITSVLREFQGDPECFTEKGQQLREYMSNSVYSVKHQDGSYDATDYQQAVKLVPIKDFLESQTHLLRRELNFHKLIKYVWGAILAKIVRRHGIGSEAWNSATDIYSSALWSTQVSANNDGKREILRRLPKIVQGVRKLFEDYGLETRIRDAILDQMIQLHLQIMRGVDGTDLDDHNTVSLDMFRLFKGRILNETESAHEAELDATEITESPTVLEPLQNVFSRFDAISPFDMEDRLLTRTDVDWGELTDEDSAMIESIRNKQRQQERPSKERLEQIFEMLNRLPLESVFALEQDQQWRRFRLADKSVVLGKFTLKAFDGDATLIRTKAELALDISRQKARVIQERSLFDDALESVVTQIQAQHK